MKFQRIYWCKKFEWDKYVKLYDLYCKSKGNYYTKSAELLVDSIDLSENMKILDLACGTGALTRVLLKKFPKLEITAVDINEIMLAYFMRNFHRYIKKQQIKVIKKNIESLDNMLNTKFDVAFIASAFWDVEVKPTIEVCYKLLKPGGYLVFNLPKIILSKKEGFIYLLEHYFEKKLGKIKKYRRIKLSYLYHLCRGKFSIKRKEYKFSLSKKNVKKFFKVLVYRYPFIFFKSKTPYKRRIRICKEIFNKILKENSSFYEAGEIFILKRQKS